MSTRSLWCKPSEVTGEFVRVSQTSNLGQAVRAVAAPPQQVNTEQSTTHKLKIDKSTQRPRVVILGSGWGAVSLLRQLPKHISNDYDIVVLSPRNYFLFTALLPQVASGNLEQHSIIESMRKIIGQKGRYFEAAVTGIDAAKQTLTANFPKHAGIEQYNFEVPYDILVYSVGSVVNTFGIKGVQEHAFFFKSIANANALRQRVCECFERAALPQTSQQERQKLLTFVVVGGGPTGVEVAAELYDLVRDDLRRFYPDIWKDARVCLVELQDHVLSTYDRRISDYTSQLFSRNGVELLINTKVESINADELTLKGKEGSQTVPYGACVWATGVSMHPLTAHLQQQMPEGTQTHNRSIVTDEYLCVKGSKGTIYALGDAATVEQPKALDRAKEIFDAADTDGNGLLTCKDVASAMQKASKEYSHLEEYSRYLDNKANSRRFGGLVRRAVQDDDAKASQGLQQLAPDCAVNLSHFQDLLREIDNTLRALPATGQVAGQEGRYLAKLFSKHHIQPGRPTPSEARPFRYSHGGDLAYVGSDKAVMQIPNFGLLRGSGAFLLWRGYETFRQISFRNKCLVAFDSLRSKVFGRDIEFGETDM
ncbi:tubulin alpha 1 [Trebouxia sp. C0009 RCD-2024]